MAKMKQCMGCMSFYDETLSKCPHCGYDPDKADNHVLNLKPGFLLHKRYVVGKSIGYGSFGVTYIGWDRLLKHKVAIKEYLPSQYATRSIDSPELMMLNDETGIEKYQRGLHKFHGEAEKLAHVGNIDGVVYVYDTFEENNTAYIIMEYLEGETLASMMEREGILTEQRTMDLMMPVLQALDAVHEKDIIHRDISPDNIFISKDSAGNEKVKLIDFGAARFATSSHSKSLTVLLRPGYSPEEQYRSSGEQGPHTDVYAIAAVMYQMVTGVRPVDALERRANLERKKKDLLKEPTVYNKDLSENFVNALMNAMNVRIDDRTPTAEAFIGELISFEKVKRRVSTIRFIDPLTWPRWAKIGVPTAAAAAIAIGIGLACYVTTLSPDEKFTLSENEVFVPSFVGSTLEQAKALSDKKGLTIEATNSQYSPNMGSGLVLSQDAATGSIRYKNDTIYLTMSESTQQYYMPDITGMSYEDACTALDCMGINHITKEVEQEGLGADCVVSQSVEPFELIDYGQDITLEVTSSVPAVSTTPSGNGSTGTVTAPNLAGLTYEEALQTAAEAGVELVVTENVFTKDYADNIVISQDTNAGDAVSGRLGITVSVQWREFEMPSLLYKDKDEAAQLMKNIGISVELKEQPSEVVSMNQVIEQGTEAKSTVEPNTSVDLVVSSGTTPFEIANVLGMTSEEAYKTLQDQKLSVEEDKAYDENVKEGCVIKQSIVGGESVRRGDQVVITICSTEGLTKVPDVVNQTYEDAKAALEEAGFKVKKNEVFSSIYKENTVMEQDKKANSMQTEKTEVILTVSKGVDPSTIASSDSNTNGSSNKNGTSSKKERTWHESEWVTSVPSGAEVTNQKTQYRYQTRSTTTSSSSSMDGWTLYDTKESWGDYGSWSDWSENSVGNDDYTVEESKTQWAYSDKETTTSQSSSLSGWTQTGSSTSYGSYGSWSSWSTAAVSSSDTRNVETTTGHYWYYFTCPYCGSHQPYAGNVSYAICYTDLGGCGKSMATATVANNYHEDYLPKTLSDGSLWNYNKYAVTYNGSRYFASSNESRTCTLYRYQDCSKTITYSYERWGSWSSWSDTSYSSSSTRQVKTRTVYRHKTRSKVATYYFEKWSNWSEYSDTPVYADENTNVQTRTLYKYKIYDN